MVREGVQAALGREGPELDGCWWGDGELVCVCALRRGGGRGEEAYRPLNQ